MTALTRIVVGVLLAAHGLVHLLFIVPNDSDPRYPFSIDRSWLLPETARRPLAMGLMATVVAGFIVSALAWWGVPGLAGSWSVVTIVAASLSIALLVAFWDKQLWIGILINVLLIVAAFYRPAWLDAFLA